MDGVRHEQLTLFHLAWTSLLFPLAFPQTGFEAAASYMAGGILGTFFLSPDLDLKESRPSKRWGALSVLWEPYRLLHPHRGSSHSYLYGPLSRLAYLVGLASILLAPFDKSPMDLANLLRDYGGYATPALLGYLFSQWCHSLQDGVRFRLF